MPPDSRTRRGFFVRALGGAAEGICGVSAPVAGRIEPTVRLREPKPLLEIGGTRDENIPFDNQKAAMDAARQENGATGPGQPCGGGCLLYASTKGAPVMTVIHGGGHVYPNGASKMIVKFFKDHPLPQ